MQTITLDMQARAPAELSLEVTGGSGTVGLVVENGHTVSWYEGPYEAVPTRAEQVLATEHRTMRRDVTVREIPYYETSNPYGKTYVIGE